MPRKQKSKLGTYGSRDIIGTALSLRKAGDGLSGVMKAEPRLIEPGERVWIVVEAVCVGVRFDAEDRANPEEGGVQRVHILDAEESAFIEEGVVMEALETSREIVRRYEEHAAGIARLPYGNEENARSEHTLDGHEGKFEDCQICADQMAKAQDAAAWDAADHPAEI